jgi:hypothetical protein
MKTDAAPIVLLERLRDRDLIAAAIRRAVQQALSSQAKLGYSAPVSQGGKVVWLSPQEVLQAIESQSFTEVKGVTGGQEAIANP